MIICQTNISNLPDDHEYSLLPYDNYIQDIKKYVLLILAKLIGWTKEMKEKKKFFNLGNFEL